VGAGFTKFIGAGSLPWLEAETKTQSKKKKCFLGGGGILKVQRLWQDRLVGQEKSMVAGRLSKTMARLWFFDSTELVIIPAIRDFDSLVDL